MHRWLGTGVYAPAHLGVGRYMRQPLYVSELHYLFIEPIFYFFVHMQF